MMPALPRVAYRLFDLTDLDDLVIWVKKGCSDLFVDSATFRNTLQEFLEPIATTTCYAGPMDHQLRFDMFETAPIGQPIIIHIQLSEDIASKAFLYLNDSTTELHIPESVFVTEKTAKDNQRFDQVHNLVDGLSRIFSFRWELAEYGGAKIKIDNCSDFWPEYRKSIFERIDYEDVS